MRLLIALVATATTLLAADAYACSCAPPPDAEVAFGAAAFVFEGKAGAVTQAPAPEGAPPGFGMKSVAFEVTRSWKGGAAGTVQVTTAGNSAACGRTYNEGEAYLIYASAGEDGTPRDSLCSRSRPLKGNEADVAVLDGLKGAATDGAAGTGGAGDTPTQGAPESTGDEGAAPGEGMEGGTPGEAVEPPKQDADAAEAAATPKPADAEGSETADDPADPSCSAAGATPSSAWALVGLLAAVRRRR